MPGERSLPDPYRLMRFNVAVVRGMVSAYWMGVQPLTQHTLYVQVDPIGVSDTNPDNNRAAFTVYLDLPKLSFLPLIHR